MIDAYRYTDEQLVSIILDGNSEVYEEIINRYIAKLTRYVKYLVPKSDEADDIVQNTFIKVYENLNGFRSEYKFSSWIYRIAHNETVNFLRKRYHETFLPDLDILSFSSNETPETEYEKKEIASTTVKCLKELPVKYKEVLTLFYLEDKSYGEISVILKIPKGTVATRINRAKEKLKKICIKYGMEA